MVKHKASHQQRGENARKRLMQAGIEVFSLNGYESARTLRQVTLGSLGWETFEGDRTDLIRSTIHQQVDDALKSQIEKSTVEAQT